MVYHCITQDLFIHKMIQLNISSAVLPLEAEKALDNSSSCARTEGMSPADKSTSIFDTF
jgi:hypothetical protein